MSAHPASAGASAPLVLVVHPGAELFGSDRMLLESVIGLRERGSRTVVALPESGPLVDELRAAGAEVVLIPMLVLRKALLRPRNWPTLARDTLRGWAAGWRLLRRLRPEAVYVSTLTLPQWPLLSRLRRARTISHIHEAEASANRLVNRALYAPHLVSDRALVNSRFAWDTIAASLAPLARRAAVVYNGVASPAEPAPPRARLDGPLRVLYVGRLSPRKGPDLLISAAAQLSEAGRAVDVTLLGSVFTGYEWFDRELRDQASAEAVPVDFAGFHPDVWPFLAAADVLVVPSRTDEPFGNTAVEGILALRPVIASDGSGLREAAGGYDTARLVEPDDATAIAEALTEIAEDWPSVVASTADSRAEALRRHAPESYRRAVAAAVLGDVAALSPATARGGRP